MASLSYHTYICHWQAGITIIYGKGMARVWQAQVTIHLPWQRYGKSMVGSGYHKFAMARYGKSMAGSGHHTLAMAKVWQEYGNLSLPYSCHGKGMARVW